MSKPKLPQFTVPITFTVDHAPGWKSGYLHMKIAGGVITRKGKRLGLYAADAFNGAPVIEIDGAGDNSGFTISANPADIFDAVQKGLATIKIPQEFDPVGEEQKDLPKPTK